SPTYTAIVAAKQLGAVRGELVEYTTSGETTGDYAEVVGYAGIIIT
ncbi:AmmeMemoRadiSam system protein B, partial [Candidatus Omnitrophota bacterium]